MRLYIIRRLLLMIPTLLVVTLVVFFSLRMIPGSIIDLMVMQHAADGSDTSEAQVDVEAIRKKLGMHRPVHIQYFEWVGNFMIGNFGESLWTGRPIAEDIKLKLPVTMELGFLAFVISQLVAFPIGIYSALKQETIGDYLGRTFAILNLATPAFWLATIIMVFPAVWWRWSPPAVLIEFSEDPLGNLGQFLIPAILVGTAMSAATMRMLRTTMLEVLRQDYVRTAWSKGLRERIVVLRHVLRNAMLPVITIISGQISIMIGGAVIMEQIFALPGMGRFFLDAITTRDYTVVSALNVFFALIGLFTIFICDLSYAWLDPRVRYD